MAAQQAVRLAEEYSKEWLVIINTKTSKSELLAFAPYLDEDETETLRSPREGENEALYLMPIVLSDGRTIQWVTGYVYLGAPVNEALDLTEFAERKVRLLEVSYRYCFKRLSYRHKLQLTNTLSIGVILYLVSIVPLSQGVLRRLNDVLIDIGRAVFDYPRFAAKKALLMELPFYPAEALVGMHTYRALMSTLMLNANPPAKRLLLFQAEHCNDMGSYLFDTKQALNKSLYDEELAGMIWNASSMQEVRLFARKVRTAIASKAITPKHRSAATFNNLARRELIVRKATQLLRNHHSSHLRPTWKPSLCRASRRRRARRMVVSSTPTRHACH